MQNKRVKSEGSMQEKILKIMLLCLVIMGFSGCQEDSNEAGNPQPAKTPLPNPSEPDEDLSSTSDPSQEQENENVPPPPRIKSFSSFYGGSNICAILIDDSLKCWGAIPNPQLGIHRSKNGGYPYPVTKIDIGVGKTVKSFHHSRYNHACIVLNDNSLKCWGVNDTNGKLGVGGNNDRSIPTKVNLGENRTIKKFSMTDSYSCAILDDDSLKCWGKNNDGQLGVGDNDYRDTPALVDLGLERTAKSIHLMDNHACAVLDNDSLKCWGENNYHGRLGVGDNNDRNSPTAIVLGASRTVKSLYLLENRTCAILDNNSLQCWGRNESGQVGDGTTVSKDVPTVVDLGTSRTIKSLAMNENNTCAILDDNSLKCWGENFYGQVGVGDFNDRSTPTEVDLGENKTAKAIFISGESDINQRACAILNDDGLKCWGDNNHGRLGVGDIEDRNMPTAVNLGMNRTAKSLVMNNNNTCAILDNNGLKCWGDNHGQFAEGVAFEIDVPTEVETGQGRTISKIFLESGMLCAILDNDSLKCWGQWREGLSDFSCSSDHQSFCNN